MTLGSLLARLVRRAFGGLRFALDERFVAANVHQASAALESKEVKEKHLRSRLGVHLATLVELRQEDGRRRGGIWRY